MNRVVRAADQAGRPARLAPDWARLVALGLSWAHGEARAAAQRSLALLLASCDGDPSLSAEDASCASALGLSDVLSRDFSQRLDRWAQPLHARGVGIVVNEFPGGHFMQAYRASQAGR